MLKNESISIIDWLLRIFNTCMEYCVVPEDCKEVYKEKDDRRECANYRGVYREKYMEGYRLVW